MGVSLQALKDKANFFNKRAGKMAGGAVGIGLVAAAAETFALSGSTKDAIAQEMIANNANIQTAFNWFSCDSLVGLQKVLPTLASDPTAAAICRNAIVSFDKIDAAAGQEALMATAQSLPVIATVAGFVALGVGLYVWNKKKAKEINKQVEEMQAQEQTK